MRRQHLDQNGDNDPGGRIGIRKESWPDTVSFGKSVRFVIGQYEDCVQVPEKVLNRNNIEHVLPAAKHNHGGSGSFSRQSQPHGKRLDTMEDFQAFRTERRFEPLPDAFARSVRLRRKK